MWRDVEPRAPERERAELAQGSRGGTTPMRRGGRRHRPGPADAGPRSAARQVAGMGARGGSRVSPDGRRRADAGRRRGVSRRVGGRPRGALRARWPTRPSRAVERLRDDGLVQNDAARHRARSARRVVTLTERGRDLLDRHRRPDQGDARQAFYAGVVEAARAGARHAALPGLPEGRRAAGGPWRQGATRRPRGGTQEPSISDSCRTGIEAGHDSNGRPTRIARGRRRVGPRAPAAVRERPRAVPGRATRDRGARRSARGRGPRGGDAALPGRARRGQGAVGLHALPARSVLASAAVGGGRRRRARAVIAPRRGDAAMTSDDRVQAVVALGLHRAPGALPRGRDAALRRVPGPSVLRARGHRPRARRRTTSSLRLRARRLATRLPHRPPPHVPLPRARAGGCTGRLASPRIAIASRSRWRARSSA